MKSSSKNKFLFLTINSFVTLPPTLNIYKLFSELGDITIIQNNINGFDNPYQFASSYYSLFNFKSYNSFLRQNIIVKVLKYVFSLMFFLSFKIKNRLLGRRTFQYSIDLFGVALSVFFKGRKDFIIYHQFELLEITRLNKLDSLLLNFLKRKIQKIDLIIVPEINRLNILKGQLNDSNSSRYLMIPNTNNNSNSFVRDRMNQEKIIINHIGSIGGDHYLMNFLSSMKELDDKFQIHFYGFINSELMDKANALGSANIFFHGQVKHNELDAIYRNTDIGVILYSDSEPNTSFCAPNKLYEYWSYGIPVVAHKLPGLTPIFNNQILGSLVDFNSSTQISNAIIELSKYKDHESVNKYFDANLKFNRFSPKILEKIII
jgi:glycosyltransferase involved in cell wall biosynthesis